MKQIIVAEDDPAIRDVFQLILERSGYKVTMHSNGEELMDEKISLPDLFIIDKQLSGIDGLDLCHYLKHQPLTKHIPVIITSASPYVSALAAEGGADDFIEKPFTMKAMLASIKKVLEKK